MGDSLQTTNNFCTFASFKEQRSGPISHRFYCAIKNDSRRMLLLSRYVMSFSSHACHSASLLYHCCIDLCESKNLMMVNTAVTRLVRESIEWIVLALSDWIPLHSDTVQSLLASLRRCGEAAELAVWLGQDSAFSYVNHSMTARIACVWSDSTRLWLSGVQTDRQTCD